MHRGDMIGQNTPEPQQRRQANTPRMLHVRQAASNTGDDSRTDEESRVPPGRMEKALGGVVCAVTNGLANGGPNQRALGADDGRPKSKRVSEKFVRTNVPSMFASVTPIARRAHARRTAANAKDGDKADESSGEPSRRSGKALCGENLLVTNSPRTNGPKNRALGAGNTSSEPRGRGMAVTHDITAVSFPNLASEPSMAPTKAEGRRTQHPALHQVEQHRYDGEAECKQNELEFEKILRSIICSKLEEISQFLDDLEIKSGNSTAKRRVPQRGAKKPAPQPIWGTQNTRVSQGPLAL